MLVFLKTHWRYKKKQIECIQGMHVSRRRHKWMIPHNFIKQNTFCSSFSKWFTIFIRFSFCFFVTFYLLLYYTYRVDADDKCRCWIGQNRNNAQSSCAGLFICANLGFDFAGSWIHVDMASPVYCVSFWFHMNLFFASFFFFFALAMMCLCVDVCICARFFLPLTRSMLIRWQIQTTCRPLAIILHFEMQTNIHTYTKTYRHTYTIIY